MSILSRLERIRGQIANCGSVERFESRNEGQGQFPDLLNNLLENT